MESGRGQEVGKLCHSTKVNPPPIGLVFCMRPFTSFPVGPFPLYLHCQLHFIFPFFGVFFWLGDLQVEVLFSAIMCCALRCTVKRLY